MDEAKLGALTGGVWTAADARRAGLTADQVRWRILSRRWQVLWRGVYTDGGTAPDHVVRGWASVLAAGGPGRALAAGRTAARLYGLPLIDDRDPLLLPELRGHRSDDVAGDRPSRGAGDLHVVRLSLGERDRGVARGVPALSPERTLLDLTRVLTHEALVCALDAALHERLVTVAGTERSLVERAGRPGAALLRRALSDADGRSESPLESLSRLLLRPVLPGLVPQLRVLDEAGRVLARLDLGDEEQQIAVESDGARWHRGEAALAADRRRERTLVARGWRVEHVTWRDVRRYPEQTRRRIAALVSTG